MKKLFFSAVALLLLVGSLFARPKEDFDKFLKSNTDNVKNLTSEKFYEKLELINLKTGEKKKFMDFPEEDRLVFKLFRCDAASHELEDLYNKWKEEVENAEESPKDKSEASKKDVNNYLDKLMVLRKENAVYVEKLIDELFKKFPNKFTKEEQDFISKNIREYHDKNNLVKREK